jgi:hypothetical protein
MADRKMYEAWVIQRQRERGYGGRLTDAEVLASFKRTGMLEFGWSVWQAAQTLANHSGVALDRKASGETGNSDA